MFQTHSFGRTVVAFALQISLVFSVFAISLAVQPAQPAEATHFRATQLTWRTVSGFTAEFTSTIALRRSFFAGPPVVGSTVSPTSINWGNGTTTPPHTVIALDAANDWILARAVVNRTYSGAGPWVAFSSTCCRLSPPEHRNNGDQNNRAETLVDFTATTASPVSGISPIIDCPKNAICTFVVPAIDADAQGIRYRLATSLEATGGSLFRQPGPPQAPNAATIDATTGVYSWDTTGASLNPNALGNSYYSTQVMVENVVGTTVVSKTAVDFFIRLSATASTNQAPTFTAPTPADGTVYNVTVGSPLTFSVAATDPNATDTVTLGMLGTPATATYSTVNGNPATGIFTWTPTTIGSVILTLTAQDQLGLGAVQRSITINVVAPANQPPVADAGTDQVGDEGSPVTLDGCASSDPDAGDTLTFSWTQTAGPSVTLSSSTVCDPSFTPDDNGTYTFELTVSDGTDQSTDQVTVTVNNVAPTADAGPDQTQYWGLGLYFVGSATDPSGADTSAGFTGAWDFGDGGTAATMAASHTYALPGAYTASFTATDQDGGTSAPDTAQVTIERRATLLSCTSVSTVFGFATTMTAQLSDRVNSTTAILAGHVITFIVDGTAAGSGVTDANGVATATSPALATPGSHTVSATFAGDALYTSSSSTACSVSVSNSAGKVTWGNMRSSNNGRGGGNAKSDGVSVTGEVQFQNDATSVHAHTVTALGISSDGTKAWISATGTNGESVLIYVEDKGEPGRDDIFRISINGVPQNGDGAISGGNVQIHR